jgi:hypothetical protein
MFSYWESNGVVIGNSVNNSINFGGKFSIQKLQEFFKLKENDSWGNYRDYLVCSRFGWFGENLKVWREIQTDPELKRESKTINFPLDTFFLKIHLTILIIITNFL